MADEMARNSFKSEVLSGWLPGFGRVSFEPGRITVKSSTIEDGGELSHSKIEVELFPALLTALTPGYFMVLSDGERNALVAPLAPKAETFKQLYGCGFAPQVVRVRTSIVFARPLLWWYVKKHDFALSSHYNTRQSFAESSLDDWLLERASEGRCPSRDLVLVAAQLSEFRGSPETAALEAINRLLDAGLVVFEDGADNLGVALNLDASRSAGPDNDGSVADGFIVATEAGHELNESIDVPRTADWLS